MKSISVIVLALAALSAYTQAQSPNAVINWSDVIAISRTTTTCQVVANAVLNPATSPVAAAFFESLANLDAELVRYVPWFPYPSVGVAELNPPDYNTNTSYWDFTNIIPQLTAFMNATYARGHSVIPNFSTQPTWMYATNDWSYPSDPNVVDWSYPQGNAYDNTTQNVAQYYGRLLSWLMKGEFTDEFGVLHTGGPQYNLTHWEVFNEPEGCHGLDVQGYTQQYDAVVSEIRAVADTEHQIQFVGLALSGREMDWISYFLNSSNHLPGIPLDYISFHFYGQPSSRTDPSSFESLFPQADAFLLEAAQIVAIRDQLSPDTKLSCDEMGVILPDDNDQDAAPIPSIYWNAAGAMYAYLVGQMTVMGYDILGESQLAGSPPIPEWDVPDAQYPSVTLVNWTTGAGTARYWVLKLLIDEFEIGDQLVNTTVTSPPPAPTQIMCGEVQGTNGYTNITLQCADSDATIQQIDFAAFGTPTGSCGDYQHDPSCDAANVEQIVSNMCVGQNYCSVLSYPTFGDPCYGTYKNFIIQAQCTGTGGGWATPSSNSTGSAPYAQGYITVDGSHKVLLVNKNNAVASINVPNATGGTILTVDLLTGDGPARQDAVTSDVIQLNAFAVAVLVFA